MLLLLLKVKCISILGDCAPLEKKIKVKALDLLLLASCSPISCAGQS